jgi:hypothetical protein
MGTIDKRQAARFNVEVAAEVYTPDAVMAASTRNLSNTGVCLDTDVPLAENAPIGVSLFFTADGIEDPDVEPLNVKAEVVWSTERDDGGHSSGAHFSDLTEASEKILEGFLSALGD